MEYLKRSLFLMLLSFCFCTSTFAQNVAVTRMDQGSDQPNGDAHVSAPATDLSRPVFDPRIKAQRAEENKRRMERAKEIPQDNEYRMTGNETGSFFDNPLMINGTPLDYSEFNLDSTGELTVIKKAPFAGEIVQVPFFVYLRREGIKVSLPRVEGYNSSQMKVNLSEILEHAKAGDHLIIEAVNKEDDHPQPDSRSKRPHSDAQ